MAYQPNVKLKYLTFRAIVSAALWFLVFPAFLLTSVDQSWINYKFFVQLQL